MQKTLCDLLSLVTVYDKTQFVERPAEATHREHHQPHKLIGF